MWCCWGRLRLGTRGTPLPLYRGVKYLDSMVCVVLCLQNRHSKWVTGKIFFLKGLWVLMGKPRLWPGLSLYLVSIIADWVELVRQPYLVCFHRVRPFGGLTRVFRLFFRCTEERLSFGRVVWWSLGLGCPSLRS